MGMTHCGFVVRERSGKRNLFASPHFFYRYGGYWQNGFGPTKWKTLLVIRGPLVTPPAH